VGLWSAPAFATCERDTDCAGNNVCRESECRPAVEVSLPGREEKPEPPAAYPFKLRLQLARDEDGRSRGRQIAGWILLGGSAGAKLFSILTLSSVNVRQPDPTTGVVRYSDTSALNNTIGGIFGFGSHILATEALAVGGPLAAWGGFASRSGLQIMGEPESSIALPVAGWITWGAGTLASAIATRFMFTSWIAGEDMVPIQILSTLSVATGLVGIILFEADAIQTRAKLDRILESHPSVVQSGRAPTIEASLTLGVYGRAVGPAVVGIW
jgi:hypothetical protein